MGITTSKIKVLGLVKPWNGQNGTVYYHNVEMENGDKINIGKQKEYGVGDELTYEIIGDLGQHEFTKAKSAKKDEFNGSKYDTKGIEVGHAINNAVNMICAGVELSCDHGNSTEEKIYNYAKVVLSLSKRLKDE